MTGSHPGEIRSWARRRNALASDDADMSDRTTYEIVIRGRASNRLLRPLLDDFTLITAATTSRSNEGMA